MSQPTLKFIHETSEFKATIILKQEKQMKFIVVSKLGKKTKYGNNFFSDNPPESIHQIISSGLIDGLKDFYVILLGVKSTFDFVEENLTLEVGLTFCHRHSVMEIPLTDISHEPDDQDEYKAVSINSSELPEQLNEEQNQIKKNNGEIYFAKQSTEQGNYQGQMLNGLKHGKGKFFFTTGDVYTGEFFQGYKHGYGQFLYQDGEKYEGNFINDQMYGKGKYYFKSGHNVDSFFKMGLENGPGIQTAPNGDISIGIYKNGVIDGKTLSFMANGDLFEFYQINGITQGYSKYYYANGQILECNYQDNKKEGFATSYWADNVKQEGNYVNDLKHGEFVKIFGDTAQVQKSYWFNGESCTQQQFEEKIASQNASPAPAALQEVAQDHLGKQNPSPAI